MDNDFSRLMSDFDDLETGLTDNTVSSVKYPFLYITDVTGVEYNNLLSSLPSGEVPLMLLIDGSYVFVKNINLSLQSIKYLSRFKHNREIVFKESKSVSYSIDKVITTLLLEENLV